MGHCCCGAHSCTTENKKNASTSGVFGVFSFLRNKIAVVPLLCFER